MDEVEHAYAYNCNNPSDIHEHMPVLRGYAEKCRHVTEFGVRAVVSTWALVCARPQQVVAYDMQWHENIQVLQRITDDAGIAFRYVAEDVLAATIEETDLLFIDTYHTYAQLRAELERHAPRVRGYIVLHDTETYGAVGEDGSQPGLWQAIEEFVAREPVWDIREHRKNNHGLTVLSRA